MNNLICKNKENKENNIRSQWKSYRIIPDEFQQFPRHTIITLDNTLHKIFSTEKDTHYTKHKSKEFQNINISILYIVNCFIMSDFFQFMFYCFLSR